MSQSARNDPEGYLRREGEHKPYEPVKAQTTMSTQTTLRPAFDSLTKMDVVTGNYRGVRFEVKMQKERESDRFPYRNYYIYLREPMVPRFEEIWLPGELKRWSDKSPERVSHNYFGCRRIANVEMHGGITFYAKHGHTVGHRCVEIGCDYNHLYDDQRDWTIQDLFFDACATIDDCFERGLLREPEAKP